MRRLAAATFVIVGALPLALGSGRAQGPAPGRQEIDRPGGRDAVAREAIVKFRRQLRQPDLQGVGAEVNATTIDPVGRTGAYLVRSRVFDAATLVARLAARADVEFAEPNYMVSAVTAPNDPSFSALWGLERIQAPAAWDTTVGSTAHVVAVIDSGVDYTHSDLAANMWSAPSAFTVTVGGSPVQCAAGTHGFNARNRACDPMDDNGHGTHVSGTIGAVGDNHLGVAGVNWTTRMMGIKFLDAQGSGSIADAINGIQFAIEAREAFAASAGADVRVLSASWGGSGFSQALLDEVNAANDADMLFVAAAGNSSLNNDLLPTYPASFDAPNVIAVAATTTADGLAWFSNYGVGSVHLGAPGDLIFSTLPGNAYDFSSGTSMATPHVSGAAALVLSVCNLSTAALKEALLATVDAVPSLATKTITGGRLNVNSALHSCIGPPAAPTGLTATAGDARVSLSWSASAGATRYIVRRGTTAGGPYESIATSVTGPAYTDATAVNDTTYYYVVAAANSLGESGNSNEASATPRAPSNLTIGAFSAPSVGGAGLPITVTITTTNLGPGSAAATTTAIFLSTNSVRDAADRRLSPEQPVGPLGPGASVSSPLTVTIPADVETTYYYLIAVADADNTETESVETNNTSSRIVRIGPDLTVSALSAPTLGAAGGSISVSQTTKNLGGGSAPASEVTFYLSANTTLDASDPVLSGGHSVPALGPNATHSLTATMTIPASTATGSYYVIAKADSGSTVTETLESNNTRVDLIRIGPDLRVSRVTTSPTTVAAGGTVNVTDTVQNQGGGPAGPTTTTLYLSTDYRYGDGDIVVGTRAVPTIAAGLSNAGTTTITIPPGTPAGYYYVIAYTDSANILAETIETNNTASGGRITITQ